MDWPNTFDWIMMTGIGMIAFVSYSAGYKEAIRDIEKNNSLDNEL